MKRKGIILAGGSGSRLYPVTNVLSKQLLPVYDKPMIYYPLCTLLLSNIQDILVISTPYDLPLYKNLLGDGSKWGISITYLKQLNPDGIAQAFILARKFIGNNHSTLILGDNIFYGHNIENTLSKAVNRNEGATIFVYHVNEPSRYGVAEFDSYNNVLSICEKPKNPKSNFAVTGLYFYDNNVVDYAKDLEPSKRGEYEITDINNKYLSQNKLFVEKMNQGYAWLDAGTHDSLLDASKFISTIEKRQGLKIACPEEIAFQKKWISEEDLEKIAKPLKNSYGKYLMNLLIKK